MLRRGLRAGLEAVWATVQGSGRLAEAATLDTFWERPWLWDHSNAACDNKRRFVAALGQVQAGAAGCC
jgi:hypothetical protein